MGCDSVSRAALIVIDVQNGFVTEDSKHVVPVIRDLVDQWQAAGGDTVFTRYFNYPGSPYERLIGWSELMSPPATDIVDELRPFAARATAVVDKHTYSLLTDREGRELVRRYQWTDLYVCGIDTESCVLKTTVDAFEHDLTPWLIKDASASHSGAIPNDAGLLLAGRFIGESHIISVTDVPGISIDALPRRVELTKRDVENVLDVYIRAWERQDPDLIVTIFTESATYHERVLEDPIPNRDEIRRYWETKVVQSQANIKCTLLNLYLDGTTAVAEWLAEFDDVPQGVRKRMREIAVLEFDGQRIASLREYWSSEHIGQLGAQG